MIATNPSGLITLSLSDEALAERAKILRYQPIPEGQRDPGKADSMPADAAVRQAMLALLLRSYPDKSDEPDEPPADIPSVQTMRAERRHATIGEAGTWLVEHVEVTDDPADFLFRADALDAAASACGDRNEAGEIDGRSERELTAIMASHVSALPAATAKRCAARDGRKERGWRGTRLKPSALLPDSEANKAVMLDAGIVESLGLRSACSRFPDPSIKDVELCGCPDCIEFVVGIMDRIAKHLESFDFKPAPGQQALPVGAHPGEQPSRPKQH